MREVPLVSTAFPPLTRSVVACLAAILEAKPDEVPVPAPEHPEPWTVWRNWLGRRGLGLVPIRDPAGFSWPGPWIALLGSGADAGEVAVVAFGAPPGIAWAPLGGSEAFEAVEAGYLVAPADVALWAAEDRRTDRIEGRVEAIAIAAAAGDDMTLVAEAVARAGHGLEGDRYAAGRGTFSNAHGRGHDLTLIEAEALEELTLPSGPLAPAAARRNIVTRGIDLNALVGMHFLVGQVECLGQRLCEPCAHLERLTEPGALRGLVHRGGLRADVLSDGVMRVGDPVRSGAAEAVR